LVRISFFTLLLSADNADDHGVRIVSALIRRQRKKCGISIFFEKESAMAQEIQTLIEQQKVIAICRKVYGAEL